MNSTPEKNKKLAWWIIGITAVCIFIFLGAQNIKSIVGFFGQVIALFMPLIIGCAFAMILNVPMRFFESHLFKKAKKPFLQKLRRVLAYLISLVLIVGVLVLVIWLIVPQLIEAILFLIQEVIDIITRFNAMSEEEILELPFGKYLLDIDFSELLNTLTGWLKTQSGDIFDLALGTVSAVIGGIFDFFVACFFSIYILFNKEKLSNQACRLIRAWLPKRFAEWIIHAGAITGANFSNFVSGQTLEALILGSLCTLGMLIFRLPYAPMIGALVAVTALIPVVGAFIGAGVGAFMIITVDPMKALFFLIFLIILQQLEGIIIYPKVIGSRVNLPAMWVLAAVTIGGGIAGAVGMLLSVPIASSIYVLAREATVKREKKAKERDGSNSDQAFAESDASKETQTAETDIADPASTDASSADAKAPSTENDAPVRSLRKHRTYTRRKR